MIRYFYFVSTLILLFLTASCQNLEDVTEPVITVPVDFNIDFTETLNEARNGFTLLVETTKEYECENYAVDFGIVGGTDEYIITLEDIIEPLDCIDGTALATANINLPVGGNADLGLRINLKNVISNVGTLMISPTKYALFMEELDGIRWVKNELLRVPTQFIWGYISYQGADAQGSVNNFYETIAQETTVLGLESGDYGHFEINSDQYLSMTTNAPYNAIETFYYSFDGDTAQLQEWVDKYNQDIENTQMSLTIYTDKGKLF